MATKDPAKDPYKELGVARDADAAAIKKAYRDLAQKYHPDRNPDDAAAEERFKQVSQAYSVLSDPEQRRNYDEFGDIALDANFDAEKARQFGGSFRGFPGGERSHGFRGGDGAGFEGLFENLFGRDGGFAPPPRAGANLETDLDLEFMEAIQGTERRIRVGRPRADGSIRNDTLTVKIPTGVDDGARIRLAGKGGEGQQGGPPGDLFATIHVRSHPVFRRDGPDLQLDVPIGVHEAILGADIEIPTLDGRVTLHVPAGTDSGTRLRLKGKGVVSAGKTPTGDLFVTIEIVVPKDLDDEARKSVSELSKLESSDLRAKLFQ